MPTTTTTTNSDRFIIAARSSTYVQSAVVTNVDYVVVIRKGPAVATGTGRDTARHTSHVDVIIAT